jgi:hypothetical protein
LLLLNSQDGIMAEFPSRALLKELAEQQGVWVSILVPFNRTYPDAQQNPARLRASLDAAARLLEHQDKDPKKIEKLLEPARAMQDENELRISKPTCAGLALLLHDIPGADPGITTVSLPYEPDAKVHVGRLPLILPLVDLIDWDIPYFALGLGLNSVVLYKCDRTTIDSETPPAGVLQNYLDFTSVVETARPVQFRTAAGRTSTGPQVGVTHGRESYQDDHRDRIDEFIVRTAKVVNDRLNGVSDPLVLVAVENYHAPFRDACRVKNHLATGVLGSPDELSEHELHRRTLERALEWQREQFRDSIGRFESRMTYGHASTDLKVIAERARAGRVESLIVANNPALPACTESGDERARILEQQYDALNAVAVDTLLHSGEVHATEQQNVPEAAIAAATFRW